MIKKAGMITIEGLIVEVRDGHKKIRRNYTYGYRSLRIQVGVDYYSVLINTSKLSEYGFLPKVGQWIRVTGRLSQSKDDYYDPSISWISQLEHIDPPKTKLKITNEKIMSVLSHQWKSLMQIASEMDITNNVDKKFLKIKLKELLQEGKISEISKRGKVYWKITKK